MIKLIKFRIEKQIYSFLKWVSNVKKINKVLSIWNSIEIISIIEYEWNKYLKELFKFIIVYLLLTLFNQTLRYPYHKILILIFRQCY